MITLRKPAYRLEFTIDLGSRSAAELELTVAEAAAMYEAGFAFSIYRPEQRQFTLSIPFAVAHDFVRNTLRIWQ